jgi:hypothetical protein
MLFILRKTYGGIVYVISVFDEQFAVILTGAGIKPEHPSSQFLTLKIKPKLHGFGNRNLGRTKYERKDFADVIRNVEIRIGYMDKGPQRVDMVETRIACRVRVRPYGDREGDRMVRRDIGCEGGRWKALTQDR